METIEQVLAMPRIGDKAPEFKAITTHRSEVSFVFNTLNARWGNPGEATPEEKELQERWTPIGQTSQRQVIQMARIECDRESV